MGDAWDEIRKKAKIQTENKFASQISSLTHLTDDEIKEIAPEPLDREKLAQLLSIVADASKSNEQKVDAINNIEGVVKIVVPLIAKLI